MDFKPGYLTNAGQKMARQAINGDIKITFTKAVGSSDDHSNDDADTINALTNLSSFNEAQLNVVGAVDATRELLKIQLSNYQMTDQNYLRSVGIYASDGSNEYLYSVLVNGDPDLVPAYNGTVPETFDVNWTAYVGRSENVNVQVSPIGMVTEEEFQQLLTNLDGFKVREITNDDDFWSLGPGIYICQGETPKHNPYNAPLWGTAISYGKTIQFFNKDGNAWVITPDNGGWERLAKEGYVDNAINNIANSVKAINSELGNFSVRELTDNDDFWNLDPGIYTVDGQTPKHNPYNAPLWGVAISYGKTIQYFNKDGVPWIITPNNGGWARNDGFPVREIADNDDFWNLKPGIYICQGENPAHNPYNDKIWGTAVSFGKTVQYFNKDGEEWIITPDNGGWEKFAKHGYVDNAVNSVATELDNQVSGFNSVIAFNQSSAETNASNAWSAINSNSTAISAQVSGFNSVIAYNQSSAVGETSNLQSQINVNSSNISTNSNNISINSNNINSVSNALNSQVSGFNSVIAYNQSSAVTNANNTWAQINNNGNDIGNLKSQTASNATRIYNAENRLSTNETKIGQLSQYRTTYSGNILNMYSLADGLYWLTGDNYNGPIDKMWANALVSHINPYDTMIVIISGTNVYMNMTSNNRWIGWNQFANKSDTVDLQNQINGVLARQSLILNQGIPVPFNGNLDPNARYYDNGRVVKITETFTINNNQSATIDVSRLGVSFSTVSTNIASSTAGMFTVGISNNIVTITLSNPQANTVSQTFNNMEIYLN